MPDSPEVRLNQLERDMASVQSDLRSLGQRADSFDERFKEVYGTVGLYARLDERFTAMRDDIHEAHEAIRDLKREFGDERKDRDKIRRDREEKERDREIAERRARVVQWLMLAALVFSAIASTVAVITVSGGAA